MPLYDLFTNPVDRPIETVIMAEDDRHLFDEVDQFSRDIQSLSVFTLGHIPEFLLPFYGAAGPLCRLLTR